MLNCAALVSQFFGRGVHTELEQWGSNQNCWWRLTARRPPTTGICPASILSVVRNRCLCTSCSLLLECNGCSCGNGLTERAPQVANPVGRSNLFRNPPATNSFQMARQQSRARHAKPNCEPADGTGLCMDFGGTSVHRILRDPRAQESCSLYSKNRWTRALLSQRSGAQTQREQPV